MTLGKRKPCTCDCEAKITEFEWRHRQLWDSFRDLQMKHDMSVEFIQKIYNDNVHYYVQLAERVLKKIGAF